MKIVANRKRWYVISASVLIPCAIALGVFGLKLGIDFTGGTVIEVSGNAGKQAIEESANASGIEAVSINTSGTDRLLIRYKQTSPETQTEFENQLKTASFTIIRTDQIGPSVSRDLVKNAFLALGVMSLAILAYITYSFRKVPKTVSAFSFGAATVIAAFAHDALFVLGVFAVLGKFFGVELDSFIITALLTVIGFSIHDTIVVFDRIREKLRTAQGKLEDTVEASIQETLVRSLNTSLVIVMVLLALFLFGGASTRYFVLALLLGMVAGTYSSIFIAAPLLVSWHNRITVPYRNRQNTKKKKSK